MSFNNKKHGSIFDRDKENKSIINHSSIHEANHPSNFHSSIHDHNKIHEAMHFGEDKIISPFNHEKK